MNSNEIAKKIMENASLGKKKGWKAQMDGWMDGWTDGWMDG